MNFNLLASGVFYVTIAAITITITITIAIISSVTIAATKDF